MDHSKNSTPENIRQPILPPINELMGGVRVLVIDDDDWVRSVIGRLLDRLGVEEYLQAENGRKGIQAIDAAKQPFNLTILDIDMPESDGMEFLRSMSQRKYKFPIMILSGKQPSLLNSIEIMAKEHGLNVLCVAQKPASIALLRAVLYSCQPLTTNQSFSAGATYSSKDILAGLENREFEAFFQPKVDIPSGRVRGCEALARWRHREDGFIGPSLFIGAIEDARRMQELTLAMLEQAASWCRQWHDAGLELTVNVNISVTSLSDEKVADRYVEIVRGAGIEPQNVILEITETLAMTDMLQCLEALCRLRLRGFGLSIDDFGTGFSSLQQLTRVPYTELKIDQVFVTGAVASREKRAVLESSIDIASKLGLVSVAEGVETQGDWNLLQQLGCRMAQGYFVAKPMSGPDFTVWARANARL